MGDKELGGVGGGHWGAGWALVSNLEPQAAQREGKGVYEFQLSLCISQLWDCGQDT